MGISFYSNLIVRCKGHSEYHRGRAIATLQFNSHLALLVTLSVVFYSIMGKRNGYRGDFTLYRPLVESPQFEHTFTLDSDSDNDVINEDYNVATKKAAMVETTVNGHGSHE